MKNIVVTGAEGKLGHYVVDDLNNHGYNVIGIDQKQPSGRARYSKYLIVNLNDLGEVYGALSEADAVIHLAAIPNPVEYSPERIFSNNVLSTYHVLEAASRLGISNVVTGSSESAYGFCWAKKPFAPNYFPVDEQHPLLPQECYGLSKVVNELIGDMFFRRCDMRVFSMRFSHILSPEQYEKEISSFTNTSQRHRILWSYVDVRDAATACRLAIESSSEVGSVQLDITANDMLSNIRPEELARQYYPEVLDIRIPLEELDALVSNKLARETLNWNPIHTWREFM
jgi:nucleoside-diphosphate-sugar epimerase